jgi:PAS domain S-box-containing protein
MATHITAGGPGDPILGSAIHTLPIHVAVIDAEGGIVATNRAWREFGDANDLQMSDTVGANYLEETDAADDEYADRAGAGIRAVLRGDREQFELEYPCHSPETRRWFLLRVAPLVRDDDRYATIAHIDITERKERERRLQEAYEISVSDRPFSEQIETLLDLGRETLGTEHAIFSRVRREKSEFVAVGASSEKDILAGDTVPTGAVPCCTHVVETGQQLVLEDAYEEAPDMTGTGRAVTAYLGVPVVVDGEVYGTLCFYNTESSPHTFTDWDLAFVEMIGSWASTEVERKHYTDVLTALDTACPDLGFLMDAEGRYLDCLASPEMEDLLAAPPDELVGRRVDEMLPAATAETIRAGIRDAIDTGRVQSVEYELAVPAGTRWFDGRVVPIPDSEYNRETVVFVARDITERKEREQMLQTQRDELTQLQRLNTLVRELTRVLQETDTREEIESAVCDRLTESALYQAVWIGSRGRDSAGGPTLVPQTSAGIDDADLDRLSEADGPALRALQTDDVQVVEDVATDPTVPESQRDVALERGLHALVAIPLTTEYTSYGVLIVYAPAEYRVSDAERDILSDFGEILALAIQRIHSQRSLTAETAIEADFRIPDADVVFGTVSAQLECEIVFDRQVSTEDGEYIHYLTVRGADPERAAQLLAEAAAIAECTVVRSDEESQSGRLEAHLGDSPSVPVTVLTEYGVSVPKARAADGDIHISAELAPEVDVRALRDAIGEVAPSVELVRKQFVDRSETAVPALQERIWEQLTAKQATTLETAHARGYYEWPRESTAADIADALDISAPTLHYRLRKAHATVLGTLLDQRS